MRLQDRERVLPLLEAELHHVLVDQLEVLLHDAHQRGIEVVGLLAEHVRRDLLHQERVRLRLRPLDRLLRRLFPPFCLPDGLLFAVAEAGARHVLSTEADPFHGQREAFVRRQPLLNDGLHFCLNRDFSFVDLKSAFIGWHKFVEFSLIGAGNQVLQVQIAQSGDDVLALEGSALESLCISDGKKENRPEDELCVCKYKTRGVFRNRE